MPHYLISIEPIRAEAHPVLVGVSIAPGSPTWRVACGPDIRFYCDEHEGPPCGGVFLSHFVIAAETTREDVLKVVGCGSHRLYTPSGRDVHELWCCACSEWIGDTEDPEIEHVSVPNWAPTATRKRAQIPV